MKRITYFITSLLLLTQVNCQSDDASTEEAEAVQYLKNEWMATEQGVGGGDLSSLREVVESDVKFRPMDKSSYLKIGMNRDNIFYFIHAVKPEGDKTAMPVEIKFGCLQYSDAIFSGKFYSQIKLAEEGQQPFTVKILDQQTIMVVFAIKLLHEIPGQVNYKFSYYKFKKTGVWDESTNYRSIFKGFGFSEEWLDEIIGDNLEREISAGACFSKR